MRNTAIALLLLLIPVYAAGCSGTFTEQQRSDLIESAVVRASVEAEARLKAFAAEMIDRARAEAVERGLDESTAASLVERARREADRMIAEGVARAVAVAREEAEKRLPEGSEEGTDWGTLIFGVVNTLLVSYGGRGRS